jgi:hypothetical protein
MDSKLLLLVMLGGQITCFAQSVPCEDGKRLWGRSIIGEAIPDGKDRRLELTDISQESVHLVGMFALSQQGNASAPSPLLIQGRLDRAGLFTANVALEVRNEETEEWKSIQTSLTNKIEATLTAAPGIPSICILVQLDAFQPYIGKYRFGRLTLQTGETTLFSLLLLTEDRGKK